MDIFVSRVSFDIGDFRAGVIGSKVLGSGTSASIMEGFLAMDDVMILGTSITKRPPLNYLCRVIDNIPSKYQFLSYGDNVFYAIGQSRAFTVSDGKNINTYDEIYKIVSYQEQNESDIVTFDKVIDLTKGEFVIGYINGYATDIYGISFLQGTTYQFDSLTEQKSNRLIWLTHVKQIKITNINVSSYVDNVAGTFVTGSSSDGFTISEDGTISANNIRADSIDLYGTKTVIGTSGTGVNSSISISISGNPIFNLVPEFGRTLYWLRTIYRGLAISTNAGIFYVKISGSDVDVSKIDGKTTSIAKPVSFRSFLIYVDSAGESLSYIRLDPLSAVAYCSDLTADNDIFLGHGGIRKILMYYANNMPFVISLMNDGACIVGAITETQKDYSLAVSLTRWFVDYNVFDISVYKQGSTQNILVLSALYYDYASIFTAPFVNPPLFSDDSQRNVFLDFYREINVSEIFPKQVDIYLQRINSNDSTFYASTNVDYFTTMFNKAMIASDASFIILSVADSRNAVCELSGTTFIGDNFLAKAGTYSIKICSYSGLNHLFAIFSKNRLMRFYGRIDSQDDVFKIDYDGGATSFNYGNSVSVGIKYSMYVHSGPLLPASQSSFSRDGCYGNAEITVHTIGRATAEVFVGFGNEYNRDDERYKPIVFRNDGFFRSMSTSGVSCVGNSLTFSLLSDSVAQVFITCVSVSFQHHKN